MPFVHWVVEPRLLSKKELDKSVDNELEAVANNTLVAVLQQLACVVKYASRIFDDVASDLKNIQNRSKTLSDRIHKLNDTVSSLDAKGVPVPVGDLTKFSVLKDHFHSSQTLGTQVFSDETRPLCVQVWYNAAALSPVHIMREIDKYRHDGCRSSKYFVCVPVFRDNQVGLDIETRRPASMCGVRGWQSDDDVGSSEISNEIRSLDDVDGVRRKEVFRLPLPEEKTHAMSLKFSYSDVPIDVTGSSFRRMASFRRSLMQQVEFFTRKKKKKKSKNDRRNTISGGPEIEAALNEFEQKKDSMAKSKKRFSIAEGARFFKEFNGVEHLYSSLRRPAENKSVQTGEDDTKQDSLAAVKHKLYETLNPKDKSAMKSIKEESKKNKNKSNIPISTYSQAMSLAVKLRGNASRSAGKGEDSGQSSSGNWSASSSTRTSVESESIRPLVGAGDLARTSSQTSLSKDSALSEGTLHNDDISDSRVGYQSDNSVSTNASLSTPTHSCVNKFSSKGTEQWLRALRKESTNSEDATDGTSTTGTLTPLLGKRTLSPLNFIDDEDSSVYSVDTDGYYTSMHTDSGLRSLSSSSKPLDTLDKDPSDDTENASTLSSVSTIDHTDSSDTKTPTEEDKGKKIPPPPPKRLSSLPSKTLGVQTAYENRRPSTSPSSSPSHSPSPESEGEARDALKRKTVIDASRIPSMCIVTPNPSDDEVSTDNSGGSIERRTINSYRNSLESAFEKKINAWPRGSNTLPRSFGRSNSVDQFSTHSWPRTPLNSGKSNEFSKSANELQQESLEKSPRLPLKYVQHITVTPGGRQSSQQTDGAFSKTQMKTNSSQAANSAETNQEMPKIIYATNSLDRKKSSQGSRHGAYVALDPQGRIVPNTNSLPKPAKKTLCWSSDFSSNKRLAQAQPVSNDTSSDSERYSVPKNNAASSIYSEPNPRNVPSSNGAGSAFLNERRSTSFQYNSNTLPRVRTMVKGPPTPLFPTNQNNLTFRPDSHRYADTLPSRLSTNAAYSVPRRQSSPPSPDEESSPRGSIADLPPPMMLMSPSTSQTARRLAYSSTPVNLMGPNKAQTQSIRATNNYHPAEVRGVPTRGNCRPSYLPVARMNQNGKPDVVGRTPAPTYRPPPNPISRNQFQARPQTPTATSSPTELTQNQQPYQIVPRYHLSPQSNHAPNLIYRNATPTPTPPQTPPPPLPPQRHYVLNFSPGMQLVNRQGAVRANNVQQQQIGLPASPVQNGFYVTNHAANARTPSPPNGRMDSPLGIPAYNKSSMSSDDLYAVIHQSKKRLNVKGDAERSASPVTYARTDSPSLLGGKYSNSKGNNPESGTLSPRCASPGDRRSWSGDPSTLSKNGFNSPGDRRSWAMDRLGPNKPTTMHDFKMLLLHAGRNNSPNAERSRVSASEMLKVTPVKSVLTPPKTPPQMCYGTPTLEPSNAQQRSSPRPINHNVYGRGRTRYAHPRTDILSSPIWEDKMEEDDESPVNDERNRYSPATPQSNAFGMNSRYALY